MGAWPEAIELALLITDNRKFGLLKLSLLTQGMWDRVSLSLIERFLSVFRLRLLSGRLTMKEGRKDKSRMLQMN